MKFSIISFFLLASLIACHPVKQEEQAERESFFMKRSKSATSIKDQNFKASPFIEKERVSEEQEQLPDNVLEGIIPEEQEEKPEANPSVNGSSDSQYIEYQEDREERHFDGREVEGK